MCKKKLARTTACVCAWLAGLRDIKWHQRISHLLDRLITEDTAFGSGAGGRNFINRSFVDVLPLAGFDNEFGCLALLIVTTYSFIVQLAAFNMLV